MDTQPQKQLENSELLKQLNAEEFNLLSTVGGVRGLLESTLPGLLFVVLYAFTQELKYPLGAALSIAIIFMGIRMLTKKSLTYALSGALGVGIGVAWAWFSGRGENFFSLGLITGSAYGTVIILANLLGFPVASMALSGIWNLPWKWWRNQQYLAENQLQKLAKAANLVSWIWAGLFILRVGLQLPFWLSGNITVLGILKLILGIPPFVLCVWLSWALLHPLKPTTNTPAEAK